MGMIKREAEKIAAELGTEDITDPRVEAEGNRRLSEAINREKDLEMARELAKERKEQNEAQESADEN